MTERTAVADLVGQLQERLPLAIRELEEERERIDAQLRSLRRLNTNLNPQSSSNGGKSALQKPGRARDNRVSPHRLTEVAETIWTVSKTQETFTAKDIIEHGGLSEPTVYLSLKELRGLEFIAKAGQAPPTKKGAKGRDLYRVLDAHVLDKLRTPNV